jgi:hypothetical protein
LFTSSITTDGGALSKRFMPGKRRFGVSTLKQAIIFSILIMVIFLYGGFVTLDWYLFFNNLSSSDHPEVTYSRITKVVASVLCFILVWMIGRDAFHKRDTIFLRVIVSVIIFGDLFFLFDRAIFGVLCFGICQILYIVRHSAGLKKYLLAERKLLYLLLDIAIGGILLASAAAFMFCVLFPSHISTIMLFAITGYSIVLCVSLWMAWATPRLGFFPKRNAYLALVGLTCFLIGDIFVGVGLTFSGTIKIWAKYMTWIMYTPGLVLPALSGYDLSKFGRKKAA